MTARVVEQFPYKTREVEHAWIPLADGTRLAVRYWLPEDAEQQPVPAILEYIPYCKRDGTSARDEAMHPYFAGHGYAAIRVDMRGSGESEGLLHGEYLLQEQDDALEVIDWISKQSWCSGPVGMMGKSWGGFNGLQVAARRPPALKCIITVYSTDDRYADDIHYMGGCLLAENANWAFTMFGQNGRPPDPILAGAAWHETWLARLENIQPWLIEWLRHQRRDRFWKHGSVCEDYLAIQCPVYAIGGWADPYTNPVPRLLAGLTAPCKALVGPWGHQYPHQAFPGPDAGFLQEALRWWDHWLKGLDNGIMDEPRYRVWMQDSVPPAPLHETRPGRWVAEPSWPSPNIESRRMALNGEGLSETAGDETAIEISSPETIGTSTLIWGNNGDGSPEEPVDQRPDDALSLTFDSAPLDQPLEILGAPVAELELAADHVSAFVAVRLTEVLPDGASALVSYGLLNLTHRNSHEEIEPLVPGERVRVRVQLNDIAHVFAAGSRVRVALSNAFWPIAWPSPKPVRLTVFTGVSALLLPVRGPRPEDEALAALSQAEMSPVHGRTTLRVAEPTIMQVTRDASSGRVTVRHVEDGGKRRIDRHGWEFGGKVTRRFSVEADAPTSARIELEGREERGRAGGPQIRIETYQDMTCDETDFVVHARIQAFENDRPVFARTWLERIPRDGI
jgi:putative CocE/NonD family hydrolase